MIVSILFLNTAFSLIDRMFQQEIINAELEKKFWFKKWIGMKIKHPDYIDPETCGGEILYKILRSNNQFKSDCVDNVTEDTCIEIDI